MPCSAKEGWAPSISPPTRCSGARSRSRSCATTAAPRAPRPSASASEAQILSRLDHPHILRLYGFSQDQGVLYMVTEFVKGEALAAATRTGHRLETHAGARVGRARCSMRSTMPTSSGVVHRDIKPANILIDAARPGAAARLRHRPHRRHRRADPDRHAVGTLTYMAPEQVLDEPIDGRADLYAFAVRAVPDVRGRRPYRSTTTAGLIREIVDGPPPDVAALLPPQALVFAPRCCTRSPGIPADRTPTAGRMREELVACREGAAAAFTAAALPLAARRPAVRQLRTGRGRTAATATAAAVGDRRAGRQRKSGHRDGPEPRPCHSRRCVAPARWRSSCRRCCCAPPPASAGTCSVRAGR